MGATRSSQGGYKDSGCPSLFERLRGRAGRGAGGENVVDEENVFPADESRIGDLECAANIEPALPRGKPRLRLGGSNSHERTRSKSQVPMGMGFAKRPDGTERQGASLVESAFLVLGTMQRYGDDQKIDRTWGDYLFNCRGKHSAESPRGWVDTRIFKRVNRFAHATLVGCECRGAQEWRWGEAARTTQLRRGV